MSRMTQCFAIAVIAIFAASLTIAADKTGAASAKIIKWADAEKNYIHALASPNDGVRASAAEFLGRYQMKAGLAPLITMLKTDKSEAVRKAAAFALILLNEDAGVQAVEESSLYDGSEKVAAFCTNLLAFQNVRSYIAVSE